MFHMQEGQLSLSLLFKKPVYNTIRHFSCYSFIFVFILSLSHFCANYTFIFLKRKTTCTILVTVMLTFGI